MTNLLQFSLMKIYLISQTRALGIIADISPLQFEIPGIPRLLRNVNAKKACGPDKISCWVLKEAVPVIAQFLQYIFTLSAQTGQVPSDWVTTNVTPVFKKGNREEPSNYRTDFPNICVLQDYGTYYIPAHHESS